MKVQTAAARLKQKAQQRKLLSEIDNVPPTISQVVLGLIVAVLLFSTMIFAIFLFLVPTAFASEASYTRTYEINKYCDVTEYTSEQEILGRIQNVIDYDLCCTTNIEDNEITVCKTIKRI